MVLSSKLPQIPAGSPTPDQHLSEHSGSSAFLVPIHFLHIPSGVSLTLQRSIINIYQRTNLWMSVSDQINRVNKFYDRDKENTVDHYRQTTIKYLHQLL